MSDSNVVQFARAYRPTLNPAMAATGSGGLAGAIVILVNAILNHFGAQITDPNIVAAEVTVVTALAGVGAHYLTRDVPAPALPALPEIPAASKTA